MVSNVLHTLMDKRSGMRNYILPSVVDDDADIGCTVADVMVSLSGSNRVPLNGFGKKPTAVFIHDNIQRLATASTCDLQLRLPVCHESDYESFKQDTFCLSKEMMVLVDRNYQFVFATFHGLLILYFFKTRFFVFF